MRTGHGPSPPPLPNIVIVIVIIHTEDPDREVPLLYIIITVVYFNKCLLHPFISKLTYIPAKH